jgi:hypothetical protein
MGMSESQYLSILEVATLIRKTPKTVRNMMTRSVFRRGIHYFRPRGSTPLFKREAVIQWVEGCARGESITVSRSSSTTTPCRTYTFGCGDCTPQQGRSCKE